MSSANTDSNTGKLMINVFDGARQPMLQDAEVLIRVIDGKQEKQFEGKYKGSNIACEDLPFYDNFGDNYTILVTADGYCDAGFTPVKITRNAWHHIDLMLVPKEGTFNFAKASWDGLRASHHQLLQLLSSGVASETVAKDRYDDLRENQAATLAAFLNITTAMEAIYLPVGTPLDYLKEIIWDEMAQDRFFAYADKRLIDQVVQAAHHGKFAPEFGSGLFHPGATRSYKQIQFGEANVQLTFHEGDTKQIDGVDCVKVEPDIDYYKDLGAHALLEVIPNAITGGLTNPKEVYVLRWIAGRHAGVPEFNPLYIIV
ncbi:MAG: hypothetical protein EPN47_15905 [Acidobacteria bacterium]|nr:MAG: hypothetical protein EPN47_15905 [Acidobacteriota bacterium]